MKVESAEVDMTLPGEVFVILDTVALCPRIVVSLYVVPEPPVTKAILDEYNLPLSTAVPEGPVLVGYVRSLHVA